jgi:hypothetical protein
VVKFHLKRRAGAFRADFSFLTIVSITSKVGTRKLVAQFAAQYAARQFLVASVARQHRLQHKIWLDRERELVKPSTRQGRQRLCCQSESGKGIFRLAQQPIRCSLNE